ncbi:response regulator [Chitinophaga japonensis]|uniref:LuxR family two component transcriptional regulator n=1 Tax=Chitinophaga japonensis TaxID=104662 RepID=A0A562SXY5_CHIJA|nr:response regulator transcription factor [Chitinophaga japonensis]TWI86217.1 LuxR family two component transcriptional regulator [Chitinophaga japonensis]
MQPQPVSLLIVDDHPVVVAGIQSLLQEAPGIRVAGCCTDGQAARAFLEREHADILLLDIQLPDINGLELCLELRTRYPHLRILALSNYNEKSMISKMLEHGASGYLLKNASTQELQEAIAAAMQDRLFFSSDVAKKMLEAPGKAPVPYLTRREKEILRLIMDGHTSNAIADILCISQLTVETHRRNIIRKFDAPSMGVVIKLAMEHGLT